MERNVEIVQDEDGRKIVVIHDIRFRGKRRINWKEVMHYLKEYVGTFYQIAETKKVWLVSL